MRKGSVVVPLFLAVFLSVGCATTEPPAQPSEDALRARGFTTLLLAARDGDLETVKREVAAGADVNHRAKNGMTALVLASTKGHAEIVRVLLGASADVSAGSEGFTALHNAAFKGNTEVIRQLLHAGANVNARTAPKFLQSTPLQAAVDGNHFAAAKMLVAAGADVNTKDELGLTPLMGAAHNGNAELVELLLAHGAAPDTKAPQGETAADLAELNGHTEVAALLRSSARRDR